MHFVLLRTETTADADRSGTLVLCARQLDKPPQLLFSAGTGFRFGGGFGGEAVEVAANICDVLKAAGVEGKLTPSEFLAVLLSATASEHWQQDLEELADYENVWLKELNDQTTTPILQDACRIAKPQPVLGTYDAKEEGKFESDPKIMSVNEAPCRTSPKASTPDKMAQDKDVAPAKGKRSHWLSRAPTPKLVEVSSPTADVQGLMNEDNIEDVTTAQPADYGILDQVCLLYQHKKRRKLSPCKDIGESNKEATCCDSASAHDGLVRFKSGKGVTFEIEDMDAAETVFGPRLLRDLQKAASASSPSEEERHEGNEVRQTAACRAKGSPVKIEIHISEEKSRLCCKCRSLFTLSQTNLAGLSLLSQGRRFILVQNLFASPPTVSAATSPSPAGSDNFRVSGFVFCA